MADASTPQLESQPIKQNPIQTLEGSSNKGASDAEKIRLFKRAVANLYGEKKPGEFKSKGPKLSGLQKMADWMNSDEVKNKGVGVTLVQGLEADKAKKVAEKPVEEPTDETPSPAPVKPEDNKSVEPLVTPPEIVIPPPLKTEYGFAAVAIPEHIEQEVGELGQHERSKDKPARGNGFKDFLVGLASPIAHPGEFARNFVQNTLLSENFDRRKRSYVKSMLQIARKDLLGLDESIPYDLPQEVLDKATEEARKIKAGKNWFAKRWVDIKDLPSGILALGQNSEMRLAEKWFKENGKDLDLLTQAKKISFSEQTELGERFALKGENKDVIFSQVGEVRYTLDEAITDVPTKQKLQSTIKSIISEYVQNPNDEELLKKFNAFYHKEIFPKIAPDKQKEIGGAEKGKELSSNILRIAQEMIEKDEVTKGEFKTKYQRYQDEKTEGSKDIMWNKLHFDVYLGKGKYDVARGEVRLSNREKKIIHMMAESGYKVAKDDIVDRAWTFAKETGTYAIAYAVGYKMAAVTVGKSFTHVGGFLVGSATAGAREGVLFSKKGGKLVGLRGKAVNDFEQVSRETASGRRSKKDAKLRPMFEKAMVDQVKATDLIGSIDTQLQKETLSADEQKQLLQALAHAKARLIMTDLSTKKGKALFDTVGEIDVAQNFIGFSIDNNNAEMTALTARIIQGGLKLGRANPELYSKLNDYQNFYKAQLRVGSFEDKVILALSRDTGITQDEARIKVTELFQELNLGIDNKDRKSLEASSKTLAGLVRTKALTTFAFSLAVAPIMGAEMKVLGVGVDALREGARAIFDAATHHGAEWRASWDLVGQGQVPLTYDANHDLQSGLSPLQKDVLAVENWAKDIKGFFESTPKEHIETIDKDVQLVLPKGVEHGFVQDHPNEDVLVDTRTGEVLVHLEHSTLLYNDKGELMVRNDDTQVETPASTVFAAFEKNGIRLVEDPSQNVNVPKGSETVFRANPIASQEIDLDGDGTPDIKVNVPANSRWVHDQVSGKYDLEITHTDGSTSHVVEDATINTNGEISDGIYDRSIIQINNGNLIASENGASLPSDAISGKEIWEAGADYRVVHANGERFDPISNETFATGENEHPYGIRFTFPEHNAINNPDTGSIDSLPVIAQNGKVGLLLQIPHFGQNGEDVAIFVPAHLDPTLHKFVVDFDPTDKTTMIDLPNGSHVSMADLSENFLNEDKIAENVSQNGGPGILGSETWYEGRQFFNLANPDSDITHQGRILGGYFDENSNLYGHDAPPGQETGAFIAIHAVHGSSPVNLAEGPGGGGELPPVPDHYEPVITIGDINKPLTETVPGYRINYDHTSNPLLSFLSGIRPIPIRENVEKSIRGEAGATIPPIPNPTPPQSQHPKPADEEGARKKLEKIAAGNKNREKLQNLPVIKAEQLNEDKIVEGHVFESAPIKYEKTTPDEQEEYEIYGQDGTGFIRAVLENPYLTISYFDEENQTLVPVKANQGIKIDFEKDLPKNIFLIGTDLYRIDIGAQAFSKVTKEEEERLKKLEWFKNI